MFPPPVLPDHTRASESELMPDPLFMGVRSAVANGPLGWLARRLDAWQEARDDRQEAAATVAAAERVLRTVAPLEIHEHAHESAVDRAA